MNDQAGGEFASGEESGQQKRGVAEGIHGYGYPPVASEAGSCA